jgi:quinol monooxygenase YgiN
MRVANPLLAASAILCSLLMPAGWAEQPGDHLQGAVYNIAHFDVMPMAAGGVDFLQNGYALLFKYRDQSMADAGLLSFRILDLVPPTTNHSEIVQAWDSYQDYLQHLSQSHTIAFRFDVQGNPRLGGICCIGSPIDDRQYTLVRSFGTPWASSAMPSNGAADAVYVISYLEFLPGGNSAKDQEELIGYGETTSRSNVAGNVSFSLLRELSRLNRYAVLEIWTDQKHYQDWLASAAARGLLTRLRPLLGSPIDRRLARLCGEIFVDSKGCLSP